MLRIESVLRALLGSCLAAGIGAACHVEATENELSNPSQDPTPDEQETDSEDACPSGDPQWLEQLLLEDPSLRVLAEKAEEYRLQVLVGEIATRPSGAPCLVQHSYRVDAEYFYPASTIKLVAAIGALQELEALDSARKDPLTIDTRLHIHRLERPPLPGKLEPQLVSPDTAAVSLRHLISAALVQSDNPSYNRLVDFAGLERLNPEMWAAGLEHTQIRHRFTQPALSPENNRYAPRVTLSGAGEEALLLPERHASFTFPSLNIPGGTVGDAYYDWELKQAISRLEDPEHRNDLSEKNTTSLHDLQLLLAHLVDPQLSSQLQITLRPEHRALLLDLMSAAPKPVEDVPFRQVEAYYRPLLPGVLRVIPDRDRLRYTNKMGQSYGFYVDSAYIEDLETGRAFFVAASIHANANGVLNDNIYQYDTIAAPFMANLGERLAQHYLNPQTP
jgi:hypothetical protein